MCSIVTEGLATARTLVPEALDVRRATGTSSLILLTVTQASFHTWTNAFLVVRVALCSWNIGTIGRGAAERRECGCRESSSSWRARDVLNALWWAVSFDLHDVVP